MEDLTDPDEKILCPYDNSHHIRRCRMAFHIVKCKKNYPDLVMTTCDFNATHMVPEVELRYHHQICPDRRRVEPQILDAQACSSSIKYPIKQFNIECDENWDDMNVPTYNAEKNIENRDILRHIDVESSSIRKNFRFNERQRLADLDGPNGSTSPKSVTKTQDIRYPMPARPKPVAVKNEFETNKGIKDTLEGSKVYLKFTDK